MTSGVKWPLCPRHSIPISASVSSSVTAQSVAKRTTVWSSSNFSQKLYLTFSPISRSYPFSITQKIWLVGEPKHS